MNAIDPISRRKLYHEVVDRLLARIRSGEFSVGERLPAERVLMEEFGVGRPAIREALLTLERMGIIEITHGERARVIEPTPQSIIQQVADAGHHLLAGSPANLEYLKEARIFFETGMVRLAAERATASDVATLRVILKEQEAMAAANSVQFPKKDMEFHRAIAAISGNPIYTALSQAVFEWLEKFHVSLVQTPGWEDVTIAEHREVCDAIARNDADAAAKAIVAHLTRANRLYSSPSRAQP
jgi:DNA-binding FadR family transcriptional regulator